MSCSKFILCAAVWLSLSVTLWAISWFFAFFSCWHSIRWHSLARSLSVSYWFVICANPANVSSLSVSSVSSLSVSSLSVHFARLQGIARLWHIYTSFLAGAPYLLLRFHCWPQGFGWGKCGGTFWHKPSGKWQQTGDLSFLVCLSPPRSLSGFTHTCAEWGCPPDANSLSASGPP